MMNVSVIIPVYNAEKFIEKAVQSTLQFPEVREVLLIDDGSSDHSLALCRQLASKYAEVKVLTHPSCKNKGVSATRNLGIKEATQEFITFLDADDYWLPNRFDAERILFLDSKVDGVFGGIDAEFIGDDGKKAFIEKFGKDTLCSVQFPAEGRDIFYHLVEEPNTFGSFFSMIALTIKKEALERNNLYINENLSLMEDKEFIIRLAYHTYLKTGIIDEGVAMRTSHDSNSIMKLTNNSRNFFSHNAKLYQSLYQWAKNKNDIPLQLINFFKLKYLSSDIAAKTGLRKYSSFILQTLQNPELLKTRFRYFAIKNNP